MAKWLQEPEYQRMSALRLAGENFRGESTKPGVSTSLLLDDGGNSIRIGAKICGCVFVITHDTVNSVKHIPFTKGREELNDEGF